MKKLDRYIAKNFLTGYVISLFVLIGLRIVIDLFINLDEFVDLDTVGGEKVGALAAFWNMIGYYTVQFFLYFRDFAGLITVFAAVFSLIKMIRNNELIAIMASGVSLKRVIMPIILIAVILSGFYVFDQEVLVPKHADSLVRSRDTLEGHGGFDFWFLSDGNGSLICSENYDINTETLKQPLIFLREKANELYFESVAQIRADEARYVGGGRWELVNGIKMIKPENPLEQESKEVAVEFFESDILPEEIPVRRKAKYMSLLSSAQLNELVKQGPKIKDLRALYAQKHERIVTPIINFVMLLISLPILVCRDPKAMKSAVGISFIATTSCFILTFICKMVAGEGALFGPGLWMWLPVLIFVPVAILEIDSMKS